MRPTADSVKLDIYMTLVTKKGSPYLQQVISQNDVLPHFFSLDLFL